MRDRIVVKEQEYWLCAEYAPNLGKALYLPIIAWHVATGEPHAYVRPVTPIGERSTIGVGVAIISPRGEVYSNHMRFTCVDEWLKVIRVYPFAHEETKEEPAKPNFGERMAALKAKKATSATLNA